MPDQSEAASYEQAPLNDFQRRLIFRAWHRGTREMDLLMGRFAERHVPGMSEADLAEFDYLLKEPDPDLYDWIAGRKAPPANLMGPVMTKLIGFRFAG